MSTDELLAQYEATGDEKAFVEAKTLYEQALHESPDDADLHINYGYLLECHARNQLRQAAAHYERAIQLNPTRIKAHYHLIGARAGLREPGRGWYTILLRHPLPLTGMGWLPPCRDAFGWP